MHVLRMVLRREGVHPRASLCLSVGSFLLPACALLVAIRSTTHGGAMSELSSPLNFVPMLMTLIGEIDESGTVLRGMGFSSERLNPGEYAVTFTKPFDSPPVVVAVAQQYAICYLPRQALSPFSVHVKCLSDLLSSAPSAMDTRFTFYAAAPA